MRRITYLAPAIAVLALAACETIQGAGRDMQSAGQMITQQGYNNSPQSQSAPQYGQATVQDPYAGQAGF